MFYVPFIAQVLPSMYLFSNNVLQISHGPSDHLANYIHLNYDIMDLTCISYPVFAICT